jgi:hypothetical protein
VATTAESALANRLDTSIVSVTPPKGATWRIKGIVARSANVGYMVCRVAGKTVVTLDMASLHAMTEPLPLDIQVNGGEAFTMGHKSSSGTAAVAASVLVDTGGD